MYMNTTNAAGLPCYGYSQGNTVAAYHFVDGSDTNKWKLVVGGGFRLTVANNGFVGIGTTTPDSLLTVNGTASKPLGGSWSVFSDVRLKKNIEPLTGALDRLLQLRSVTFEYKDPQSIHEAPGVQIGMIAQEVEKVFPDWVDTAPNGMKRLSIHGFEALTVQALRELREEKDARISELEQHTAEIQKQLAAERESHRQLEARFSALEAAVAKLSEKQNAADLSYSPPPAATQPQRRQ
jgi:BMFP domain-containing protein YqiC